jgi:hypothetical protein
MMNWNKGKYGVGPTRFTIQESLLDLVAAIAQKDLLYAGL